MYISVINFNKLGLFNIVALFLLTLLPLAYKSQASERFVNITPGTESIIKFEPNETTKVVNLIFFSTNPKITTAKMNLSAPAKSNVSIKSLGVPSSMSLENALRQLKRAYTLELATNSGRFVKSISIGGGNNNSNNSNSGGKNGTFCNGFASNQFRPFLESEFKTAFGRVPNDEAELCDYFFGDAWRNFQDGNNDNSGGNTNPGFGTYLVSHILKDVCAPSRIHKYLVVISINFSKISTQDKSSGFEVKISLTESVHQGGEATSIKPFTPEGRFKGKTLTLAEMISYNDRHGYLRWSGGSTKRISMNRTLNIGKVTPHMGRIYNVSLPGALMSGGRMTLVPFNDQSAYGVCIRAVNTRQCYNGYIGGECQRSR